MGPTWEPKGTKRFKQHGTVGYESPPPLQQGIGAFRHSEFSGAVAISRTARTAAIRLLPTLI